MKYLFAYLSETERVKLSQAPGKFNQKILNEVNKKLKNAYMKSISCENDSISFVGNIFRFVWNGFNLFNPIYSGKIEMEIIGKSSYITYKLFFWEFFIIALLFSLIPILGIFPNFMFRFIVFAIIWMIYIISTLIATHRFENFLKKKVLKYGGYI